MRAFISYSHKDAAALERLHTHLAPLTRGGHIQTWYDRAILGGGELNAEIQRELNSADLFLLIVSPDFLASDYCIEREFGHALERHSAEGVPIVPIIVEECDWKSVPRLSSFKALPRDGKAVSSWHNANSAYLDVVSELRRIIEARFTFKEAGSRPRQAASSAPVVSGYRVKRQFDDVDKMDFRDSAFAAIKDYFWRAADEIDSIDGLRGRFSDRGRTSFGATVVNRGHRNGTAHITVHCGGPHGDISYTFSENGSGGSAHGWFRVEADDYTQFLTSSMRMTRDTRAKMTPEHAAETLWREFIAHAAITTTDG